MELLFTDGPNRDWKGLDAVTDAWREFQTTWQTYRIEAEQLQPKRPSPMGELLARRGSR